MILNPEKIKEQYENVRLSRYARVKVRVFYTSQELQSAYDEWTGYPYGREHLWDKYCDVRDRVPSGTNACIRRDRSMGPWVD